MGPLFYRKLERDKCLALKCNNGNFETRMTSLSQEAKDELKWWHDNVEHSYRKSQMSNPDVVIYTDASLKGYGGVCGTLKIGGRWSDHERQQHINYLELLAIQFVRKSFVTKLELSEKNT